MAHADPNDPVGTNSVGEPVYRKSFDQDGPAPDWREEMRRGAPSTTPIPLTGSQVGTGGGGSSPWPEAGPRSRTPDHMRRDVGPTRSKANYWGQQPKIPSGLLRTGRTTPRATNIDQDRLDRYFGSLIAGSASDDSEIQGLPDGAPNIGRERLMETRLKPWGQAGLVEDDPEAQSIVDLVNGSASVMHMLDAAIQLSFDDDDAFIKLQTQLMLHGFVDGPMNYGVMDDVTAAAISQFITMKMRSGDDETVGEFLNQSRSNFFDQTFEQGTDRLAEERSEEADELKRLRAQIEEMDLSNALTSSDTLKADINVLAQNSLGRSLETHEIEAIIGDVHDKERKDFWANDPDVQRYNHLMSQWEKAVTNSKERADDVLGGDAESDLDVFLAALESKESGGDGTASNIHTKAFGLYQFTQGTWDDATRRAGLDRNDRSTTNQRKVARYLAASYFKMFGNWEDVAMAWYAGPGSDAISSNGANEYRRNKSQARGTTDYPTIQSYANDILDRMNGSSTTVATQAPAAIANMGDPGSGSFDPMAAIEWYNNNPNVVTPGTKGPIEQDTSLSDYSKPERFGHEFERFDPEAYLESAVNEAGGVDVDAYSFVNQAQAFYSLLGER